MELSAEGVGFVVAPFVDEAGHIVGPEAIEEHPFARTRMGEAQGLGMEYLTRA